MSTHIGITDENRAKSATQLNLLLADEHLLYIKTRNYHWNVRGMYFQSLHKFFEEQYTEIEGMIDEVAERIRALGHVAIGRMSGYLEMTRLLESDHSGGEAREMLQNLLDDHETIIKILRKDLEIYADKFHDMGTSDFVTGLMESHEKMAWMIRSYING